VDRKLFRSVSIRNAPAEAAETLALLDKSRMVESDLEHLWQSHFTNQEVRAVIEELFGTGVPNPVLVSIVKKRSKGLSATDVKASLARVRVELDFPPEAAIARPERVGSAGKVPAKNPGGPRKAPTRVDVSLTEIIAGGVIKPPFAIFSKYRKSVLSATIEADGRVTFRGTKHGTLSAAGSAARKFAGAKSGYGSPPTNGWTFWMFTDADGQAKPVSELRERYLRRGNLRVVG
jgi:hypothetical protein